MLEKKSLRNNGALFQNSAVTQPLTELHNKYVLISVDKATCNIAIICSRFYALTWTKKLGLDRNTRNETINTYETCINIQVDLVIARHSKDLCNNFHISVNNDNKRSLLIYLLQKLHKNQTKTRFI